MVVLLLQMSWYILGLRLHLFPILVSVFSIIFACLFGSNFILFLGTIVGLEKALLDPTAGPRPLPIDRYIRSAPPSPLPLRKVRGGLHVARMGQLALLGQELLYCSCPARRGELLRMISDLKSIKDRTRRARSNRSRKS